MATISSFRMTPKFLFPTVLVLCMAACSDSPEPPPAPASSLSAASDMTGLLGVPLPVGAQLKERISGNPSESVDPREKYEITATATEILAFYEREMPRAGWKKTGPPSKFALYFTNGPLMIGILTNQQGGRFTLMGS